MADIQQYQPSEDQEEEAPRLTIGEAAVLSFTAITILPNPTTLPLLVFPIAPTYGAIYLVRRSEWFRRWVQMQYDQFQSNEQILLSWAMRYLPVPPAENPVGLLEDSEQPQPKSKQRRGFTIPDRLLNSFQDEELKRRVKSQFDTQDVGRTQKLDVIEQVVGKSTAYTGETKPVRVPAQIESRVTKRLEDTQAQEVNLDTIPRLIEYKNFPFSGAEYELPLGLTSTGPKSTDFDDGAVHIGLFGTSRCGKDNLLRVWFTALTQRHTPAELKMVVLDGKGDWINAQINDVPHFYIPVVDALDDAELDRALSKLVQELETRRNTIFQYRCANVRDYNKLPGVTKIPKLVVIFSDVADKLHGSVEKNLNILFAKAAAYDIHLIASFQSPSGCSTNWRNNLSLTVCGKLGQASQDAPAMGCAPSDLLIRPSNLPSVAGENKRRGIFLVKPDDKQFVVQTPLLDQADFIEYCDRLSIKSFDLLGGLLAQTAPLQPQYREEEVITAELLKKLAPSTVKRNPELVSAVGKVDSRSSLLQQLRQYKPEDINLAGRAVAEYKKNGGKKTIAFFEVGIAPGRKYSNLSKIFDTLLELSVKD